jgi:hypothetical protein
MKIKEKGQGKKVDIYEANNKLAARVIVQNLEIRRLNELQAELVGALERTLPIVKAAAGKEAKHDAVWKHQADIVNVPVRDRQIYAAVTAAIKKAREKGDA